MTSSVAPDSGASSGGQDRWAVLIERSLSDHTYGAHIDLDECGDRDQALAELHAILDGRRADVLAVPAGARIVEFGPGQCGVIVDHRVRSSELTRLSLVRIRR